MDDEGSEHLFQEDHTSIEGSISNLLEIEVAAEDFYENVATDADFVNSMCAFLLNLGKRGTDSRTRPWLASGDTTPHGTNAPNPATRKYQFKHSGKSRIRLAVKPDEKECLATWVTVGNLTTWTLWDSGSTTTGITPAFAELAKIKVDTLEDLHMLQLGTVGSQSIIKYGVDVLITVAGAKDTTYINITNFDRYDMIIGTPWMQKHNVILDFAANRVVINGCPIPAIKIVNKDLDPRSCYHQVMDKHKPE
jgi:hypothetical protein